MESCIGVEQDLEKSLERFDGISEHSARVLEDGVKELHELKNVLSEIPPDNKLTNAQSEFLDDTTENIKEIIHQVVVGHRDLHAGLSRIGKSIDRHFVCDYAAVAPKAESFCSDENRPIMEAAIAQHMYRQGLEDVADVFVSEAGVSGVERRSPFATVERIAAALCAGDSGPALRWVQKRQHELTHSPLPFTLHTMHALKLARERGPVPAIEYAREHFPPHAPRFEKQLQAAVCALAWCVSPLPQPPPPAHYKHLLNPQMLGQTAAEQFVAEACSVLRLAPLSPLAGATRAGCRVLPPLLDIRSKVTQPHVIAAWAGDDLPLEVDLGEDAGYHSVFACPILRQQASEQNPPMRLLCGHVISRDALNKLVQGLKLKCPYCPMEQSPSEARQIYFA